MLSAWQVGVTWRETGCKGGSVQPVWSFPMPFPFPVQILL